MKNKVQLDCFKDYLDAEDLECQISNEVYEALNGKIVVLRYNEMGTVVLSSLSEIK